MRSNGTGLRRVTRNPFRGGECGCDTDPNFSPNGKLITFVRIKTDGRQQALFAVRPNGSGLRQLTPYSWEVAIKHDWSPDGKLILLTTNADFVLPRASANLVTIRPDGSGMTDLTGFTGGTKNAFAGSSPRTGSRSSSASRRAIPTVSRSSTATVGTFAALRPAPARPQLHRLGNPPLAQFSPPASSSRSSIRSDSRAQVRRRAPPR